MLAELLMMLTVAFVMLTAAFLMLTVAFIDCVDCVNGFATEDIDTVDCMAIENGCKIGDDTDIVDVIGCDDNVTEGDPMTTKMVSKNLTNQKCGEDV